MIRAGTLATLAVAVLAACATPKQTAEQVELEAEIAEAEAALAALTVEDALLIVAQRQDARRDVLDLYPLRRHTSPIVRAAATRAMGLIGDPDAAGAIAGSLRDTDPTVRSAAAFALSQQPTWRNVGVQETTGVAQAEQWLLEALEEELAGPERMTPQTTPEPSPTAPPSPLRALARALGEIGQDDGAAALWGLIADTSLPDDVRAEALLALGIQARRKVAEPTLTADEVARLAPLLIEKTPSLQWPAAYLVSRAGVAEDAVEKADGVLAIAWRTATDGDVRAWILRAVGKVGGPSTHEILAAGAVKDASLRDRVSAGRGASAAKDTGVLLALLDDVEPMVQDEAARGLAGTGTDAALEALMARVERPSVLDALPTLWAESAETRPATLDMDAIFEVLTASAAAEDPKLRRSAYGALAAFSGDAARDALLERVTVADGATTMSETDPTAALYLALSVAQRAEPEVEGALLGWLGGDDPLLGAVAADGLAAREGAHISARLAEVYLEFPDAANAERRLSIVKALVERDDTPAGTLLKAMVDDDGLVREAAVAGVRKSVGVSQATEAPKLRDYPEIADGWWGMKDVTGAVLETSRGTITLQLFPDVAPGTVANFVTLAEAGYFDGLLFHRVVPDFVIQGGDPLGSGWGGPGHTIRCEYSPIDYERGTLGMALSGKDTGGSQWFITHTAQPHLTGHYTVFGRMTDGWDVLDAVRVEDTIHSVTIVR